VSLYNQLMGVNKFAPVLIDMLGLKDRPIDGIVIDGANDESIDKSLKEITDKHLVGEHWYMGRFRDIFLTPDGQKIVLFARNGTGSWGGTQFVQDVLRKHPNYLRDYEDEFDRTYTSIEFSIPDIAKGKTIEMLLARGAAYDKTPLQKFRELIDKLKSGVKPEDDPEVARAMAVGKQVVGKLQELTDEGKSGIIEV